MRPHVSYVLIFLNHWNLECFVKTLVNFLMKYKRATLLIYVFPEFPKRLEEKLKYYFTNKINNIKKLFSHHYISGFAGKEII